MISGKDISSTVIQKLLTYLQAREKALQAYISLMKHVSHDLSTGDDPALEEHSRIEESLIQRLESLQRTISAFRREYPDTRAGTEEEEMRFQALCEEALRWNSENRKKLAAELGSVSGHMSRIRKLRARTGISRSRPKSRYIDIEQ